MLTVEETELLTHTGPGTPMGNLFRRFWMPVLLPTELPEPDCTPVRVRILGEDLIAFRDSHGAVGLLSQNCPHRGASLFFGRNEECGLRCVYHGWKFDVNGNCVDMPNEPAESNFTHKVQATAYPAAEWGGLVWVYMGPKDKQPPLPQYAWCMHPRASETQVRKWLQDSNYSQGTEGDLDSAHVSFLHRDFSAARARRPISYGAPDLTVRETDFGFVYGARRPAPENQNYWRVTTFILPLFVEIPGASRDGAGHITLPMDDEHSWWFQFSPPPGPGEEPMLKPGQLTPGDGDPAVVPHLGFLPNSWRRIRNRDNDYLLDREMQRTVNYTGLPGNRVQDQAMTESMGAIPNRTQEHLGTTDAAIIFWRRYLMRLARELEQGQAPAILSHPELFHALPIDEVTPESDFERLWQSRRGEFLTLR